MRMRKIEECGALQPYRDWRAPRAYCRTGRAMSFAYSRSDAGRSTVGDRLVRIHRTEPAPASERHDPFLVSLAHDADLPGLQIETRKSSVHDFADARSRVQHEQHHSLQA